MLTDLTFVKTVLKVAGNSQDTYLTSLLNAADAVIKKYCNRNFERQTYTEIVNGNNTKFIWLRETPVYSITSIHLDNQGQYGQSADPFPASTLLTHTSEYALQLDSNDATYSNSGVIYRVNTIWPEVNNVYIVGRISTDYGPATGNIKVVYVGGFTPIPYDLQYAVALLISIMKRTTPYGYPLTYEKIGEYAYQLRSQVMVPELGSIRQILGQYRNANI